MIKILQLINYDCDDISSQNDKFKKWFFDSFGVETSIEKRVVVLDPVYEVKGVFPTKKADGSIEYKQLFGLKYAFDTFLPEVEKNKYHIVKYFYYPYRDPGNLANYTYNKSMDGAVFCEFPTKDYFIMTGETLRRMEHETIHALVRLLNWRGVVYSETIDPPHTNEEDDIKFIRENIGAIDDYFNWSFVKILKSVVSILSSILKMKEEKRDMVFEIARAIQEHEGWWEGSRSCRNNNPGNLRGLSEYTRSLGAVSVDKDNFCKFPDYKIGFSALEQLIRDAFNKLLIPYKKIVTIKDFFSVYAPSFDNNDPDLYAKFVCDRVKISIDTKVEDLVNKT